MKVVIEEKVKHRLVGIAVILSVGVVFAPAILKKSQRRFEETVSVSVKLPPKPIVPQVSVREPNALFKNVKVARVDVPTIDKTAVPSSTISKAEPLSPVNGSTKKIQTASIQADTQRESALYAEKDLKASRSSHELVQTAKLDAKPPVISDTAHVSDSVSEVPPIKSKQIISQQPAANKPQVAASVKQPLATKNTYGVQLATFAVQNNALALITKLKSKGYPASLDKVAGKNGIVYYKVVVGNATERQQAQVLLKQLAQTVRMNGFVVSKGVS